MVRLDLTPRDYKALMRRRWAGGMAKRQRRISRLAEFDLLLRIGRGGMADVWVARLAEGAGKGLVAVKVVRPHLARQKAFRRMFFAEAELVSRICHTNVVNVYDARQDDGLFMTMEWIEGDSLHALIAEAGKRRPIPPEIAVRIIADAASGLHAAHELCSDRGELLGVVHRDVSPHNILIRTDGVVKLVDFGVAKARDGLDEMTAAGQLRGKFGYMSPEQAMAEPVDRRSDVFSLGIVLFELTTGRRLFRGDHDAETVHLVVSGEIPSPTHIIPDYPAELERIVLKALNRKPEARYQTADQFRIDLEAYLMQERIVVPRAGVAALLQRVLGGQIAERRRAVALALGEPKSLGSEPRRPGPVLGGDEITASGADGADGADGTGVTAIFYPGRRLLVAEPAMLVGYAFALLAVLLGVLTIVLFSRGSWP